MNSTMDSVSTAVTTTSVDTEVLLVKQESQTPSERAAIRQTYLDIDAQAEAANEKGQEVPVSHFKKLTKKTHENFGRVCHVSEVRYDAKALSTIAEGVKQKFGGFSGGIEFKGDEFAKRLKTITLGPTGEERRALSVDDWKKVLAFGKPMLKLPPSLELLGGTFDGEDVGPPLGVKKERAKALPKPKRNTELIRAKTSGDDEENETSRRTAFIVDKLRHYFVESGETSVDYFKAMMDPNSFGRSVANMFCMSVLTKDGACRMVKDERGLPRIEMKNHKRREGETAEGAGGGQPVKNAMALSINMAQWRRLVEKLNLTEPFIQLSDDD